MARTRLAVALAALSTLACARTSAEHRSAAALPDAALPAASTLPTSRSDILASYVDASTLSALSAVLARAGLSPCAQAFAMSTPGGTPSADASRARYVSECEKLPPPVQRCLGVLYASAHSAECQRIVDGLDAGARAAVGRLQAMRPTPQ